MKISVIMPSYLGPYKNAAKDRDKKIVRAIQSVINQTYENWELIVVADGCMETKNIVSKIRDLRVRGYWVTKQPIWSGIVRNTGLDAATGEYSCYLDIDDAFGATHLEEIAKKLKGKDWYWIDDYVWDKNNSNFRWRKCNINRVGQCGTSNLVHRTDLARWNEKDNYAHDWKFIANLKKASKDYEYIKAGKYLVCHIPGRFDI